MTYKIAVVTCLLDTNLQQAYELKQQKFTKQKFTKETIKTKEKDLDKKRQIDTKCRICSRNEESIFHLVCSYPVLALTLYLHVRHNQVVRILYQEVLQNKRLEFSPPEVTTKNQLEVWWDQEIKTTREVKQNRPNMTI